MNELDLLLNQPLAWGLAGLVVVAAVAVAWLAARLRAEGHERRRLGDEAARLEAILEEETGALADARTRVTRLEAECEHLVSGREAVEAQRREAMAALEQERAAAARLQAANAELTERLDQERRAAEEKLALLDEARAKLSDAFKSLSSDALSRNNESFLRLARENLERFQHQAKDDLSARHKAIEQLTAPIRERLEKFDTKLDGLEQARTSAYSALTQQVNDLLQTHLPQLHRETADLVKALRQPQARGRWGELQLKRVVEMAGMLEHCDFDEQVSQSTENGRLRPDLIVHLPGGRQVVVDAKAPVDAYLQAVEAQDETARKAALVHHARQVRNHVGQLAKKSYFDQFDPSPEFVVLFVPGEAFFSAALAEDPGLIEYGAENRVIPASPTTLIALLKAVSYGWRQEAMAQNAAEVAALGKELYERIGTLAEHWTKVGKSLNQTVNAYNSSVGTLETRVLPSARKFRDLKTVSQDKDLKNLEPVTQEPRPLTA
ncbi:DNA recombination protein RmuC, partial [Guyparkeria sp.]|uniref:DNA recombination protein RmuC n=1 Tax=Guyparkeria sp. TaxID=2035736 RepID=UPI003561F8FD